MAIQQSAYQRLRGLVHHGTIAANRAILQHALREKPEVCSADTQTVQLEASKVFENLPAGHCVLCVSQHNPLNTWNCTITHHDCAPVRYEPDLQMQSLCALRPFVKLLA